MEPVYFVMALMGCADAGDLCREARIEPVRYTSIQACQAQQPAALRRNSDLDYPEISAQCRASGQRWAAVAAKPRG